MRQQWIELTKEDGTKVLAPTQGLGVYDLDEGALLFYVPSPPDAPTFPVNATYEEVRAALEKVGQEHIGSIICVRPTDTKLDVPSVVVPAEMKVG